MQQSHRALTIAVGCGLVLSWYSACRAQSATTQQSLDVRLNAKSSAVRARAPGTWVKKGLSNAAAVNKKWLSPLPYPIVDEAQPADDFAHLILNEALKAIFDFVDQFIATLQLALDLQATTTPPAP